MHSSGYRSAALWLAMAGAAAAQTATPPAAKPSGFPWQNETLHYTMNWRSGLPVGDVYFIAHQRSSAGWDFEARGSTSVPGFAVVDRYLSSTGADLCSMALERNFDHAGKKGRETITFDQKAGTAQRRTLVPEDGGSSDISIGSCARDAVAFSYYAREELGQGRVPASVTAYLGSAYSVSMVYAGAQDVGPSDKKAIADRMNVSVKGPKSDFHFEVYYARDAARTPLQIRVPLSMGTFTLDLVR